jgi:signal transduction histidine kinase
LPESVLQYVQRTGERVLLDDAAASASRFSGDPYFVRARPRSVLCLPIRRQAEVVALLYLENELAPGAFTRERLLALELLAGQAAISLENALLLERERAERAEAQAEQQRAVLLGEATALISSTPDYEGVFEALARLCARSFADWAVIDLLEGGQVSRLAGAHRDPLQEPLLRELAQRYPARLGSPSPVTRVLATGEPVHLAALTDEQLAPLTVDARHLELIRRLAARSLVSVPLVARGARLGALTLVSSQPHRFAQADVALAQELGRRAALAIENARLLRLREEFVSVASHELRTPVTALRLAVDLLLRGAAAPGGRDRLLRRIRQKTERLEQLTTELLEVSQAGYGRMALHLAEVELGALVLRVLDRLELDLASAHCLVELSCPEPVRGRWDAGRLEQVVTGLLTNALKFGAGQPIEIRVSQAGGQARLSVRDRGLGIEPGRQAQVFDRFERAVPSTRYGGLGLGLYLARTIVQAHGGTIGLESQPGQGATFTVELPCDGPALEAPAAQH